jgi:hypothetical protein
MKYVMKVSRAFRYWTLGICKQHTVRLHHVFTAFNDMFEHMDGIIQALAKEKTLWLEDMFFVVT